MSCTTATLKGLAKDCGANVGGIKKIILAPYSANTFSTAGEPSGKIHCYTLTASTDNWYAYYVRKGSSSATSTLNVDAPNGVNYVTTELSINFGKMSTAKREELAQLVRGDLVACFKDANNHWWVMGVNRPVTATASGGQTGQNLSDPNNYTLTLTSEDNTFPYELNNVSSQAADACDFPTTSQWTNAGVWEDPHQHTEPYGG